jgi:hypothetical protein
VLFISVLLGHSEPKYLAADECALGFRSSEIVGLVMLQKWLQKHGSSETNGRRHCGGSNTPANPDPRWHLEWFKKGV